jgi:hypothetical protein
VIRPPYADKINGKAVSAMKDTETFTVYDNRTNKIVARGTYSEVEDYIECEGRYSVVSNLNGIDIAEM